MDAKNGKGVLTYAHGHYEILTYKNNAPLVPNPETLASEVPILPRPGVNC